MKIEIIAPEFYTSQVKILAVDVNNKTHTVITHNEPLENFQKLFAQQLTGCSTESPTYIDIIDISSGDSCLNTPVFIKNTSIDRDGFDVYGDDMYLAEYQAVIAKNNLAYNADSCSIVLLDNKFKQLAKIDISEKITQFVSTVKRLVISWKIKIVDKLNYPSKETLGGLSLLFAQFQAGYGSQLSRKLPRYIKLVNSADKDLLRYPIRLTSFSVDKQQSSSTIYPNKWFARFEFLITKKDLTGETADSVKLKLMNSIDSWSIAEKDFGVDIIPSENQSCKIIWKIFLCYDGETQETF